MGNEDKALGDFFNVFDERLKGEARRASLDEQIIARKKQKLEPLEKLLKRFTDMGLTVKDSEAGQPGVPLASTKTFSFYEAASSPTWAPGVSLFVDHPAQMEIAIPNDGDMAKMGEFVISVTSRHADAGLLQKKFKSAEAAQEALAKFMAKNTLSIEHDPRRRQQSHHTLSPEAAAERLAQNTKEQPGEE